MSTDRPITIRDLYPHLTKAQLAEAEVNIRRYLAAVIRIAERLETEGHTVAHLNLTASRTRANVPDERSNSPISNN